MNERLKITSKTRSATIETTIRPKSTYELECMIKAELKQQGPDADLNFIDVSNVTSMVFLFSDIGYVRDIKIDKWDVSNVKDMEGMFRDCYAFDCDLSSWDVSNVRDMSYMFYGCESFESDLSSWNVWKVNDWKEIFTGSLMEQHEDLQPYFV